MYEPTVARPPEPGPIRPEWPRGGATSDGAAKARVTDGPAPSATGFDRVELSGAEGAHAQAYAKFSFSDATGSISIQIVDPRTDEVIREIPPEQVARIAEELQALARRAIGGGHAKDAGLARDGAGARDGGVDRYV
jgi:hypothetical protein